MTPLEQLQDRAHRLIGEMEQVLTSLRSVSRAQQLLHQDSPVESAIDTMMAELDGSRPPTAAERQDNAWLYDIVRWLSLHQSAEGHALLMQVPPVLRRRAGVYVTRTVGPVPVVQPAKLELTRPEYNVMLGALQNAIDTSSSRTLRHRAGVTLKAKLEDAVKVEGR